MPKEVLLLRQKPTAVDHCPRCHEPFSYFLRGQVQRSTRWFGVLWRRPYCAIICQACKEIVGWEKP